MKLKICKSGNFEQSISLFLFIMITLFISSEVQARPIPISVTKDIFVCNFKSYKKCKKNLTKIEKGSNVFVVKQEGKFFLLKTKTGRKYWITESGLTKKYTQVASAAGKRKKPPKTAKISKTTKKKLKKKKITKKIKPEKIAMYEKIKVAAKVPLVKTAANSRELTTDELVEKSNKSNIPDYSKDHTVITDIPNLGDSESEGSGSEGEAESLSSLDNGHGKMANSFGFANFWKIILFFFLSGFYLFIHRRDGGSAVEALMRDFGLLGYEDSSEDETESSLRTLNPTSSVGTLFSKQNEGASVVSGRASVFKRPESEKKSSLLLSKDSKNIHHLENNKQDEKDVRSTAEKDALELDYSPPKETQALNNNVKKIISDETTEEITDEITAEISADSKAPSGSGLDEGEEFTQYLYPGYDGEDDGDPDDKTLHFKEEKVLKDNAENDETEPDPEKKSA